MYAILATPLQSRKMLLRWHVEDPGVLYEDETPETPGDAIGTFGNGVVDLGAIRPLLKAVRLLFPLPPLYMRLPSLFYASTARLVCVGCAVLLSACNLTLDLDDFSYDGRTDMGGRDAPEDLGDTPVDLFEMEEGAEDMGDMQDMSDMSAGPPTLIITELLIDPGPETSEDGEFLEIYNAGSIPADISQLCLRVLNSEDPENPRPISKVNLGGTLGAPMGMLAPGDYFLFIKGMDGKLGAAQSLVESEQDSGRYYIFGTKMIAFANSEPRTVQILYGDSCDFGTVLDQLVFDGGLVDQTGMVGDMIPAEENRSWSLHPDGYDPRANDSLQHWCLENAMVGSSRYTASPYAPLSGAQCDQI